MFFTTPSLQLDWRGIKSEQNTILLIVVTSGVVEKEKQNEGEKGEKLKEEKLKEEKLKEEEQDDAAKLLFLILNIL